MPNSPSFVEHAVDLLSAIGPVRVRRMFGGHGLYCDDLFFALLDDDELFLKTDAESRPAFVEAGCRMWVYPGAAESGYYRPPDDAHEDPEAMAPWARLAIEAASRQRASKAASRQRRSKTARGKRAARRAQPRRSSR